ncbi:MAG: hypothetical protein ACXWBN_15695 [Acidimicrobiales bacterium]
MPRRSISDQVPLPFETDPDAPTDKNSETEQPGIEQPRLGRPRVWASEADRKRAYRQRLAADHAEPERLRQELRAERKRVADRGRQLARLNRDLSRARAESADFAAHQADLEAIIEGMEARVEFWRSQANHLEERLADERDRRRQMSPNPPIGRAKPPRQLPDLRMQQGTNPAQRRPPERRA